MTTDEHDTTTIIAALALAAQMYADPTLIYEELERWHPGLGTQLRERLEAREAA